MKINLERLEELKTGLFGEGNPPDFANHEPLGLQIIMEALRGYIYNENQSETITKLLKDYGILVEDNQTESPIVKPFEFTTNG